MTLQSCDVTAGVPGSTVPKSVRVVPVPHVGMNVVALATFNDTTIDDDAP